MVYQCSDQLLLPDSPDESCPSFLDCYDLGFDFAEVSLGQVVLQLGLDDADGSCFEI